VTTLKPPEATADRPHRPSLRAIVVPLSGLLIAQFVAGLSATIVATSIPSIQQNLAGPTAHSTWIVAATILGNTASLPVWGKLGDRFNPKGILQAGLLIFAAGSLVAGLSANTTQLIVGRALQGIGLGGILALIVVVVAALVEPRQRGRVNAWLSTVQTTATLGGPVLGGLIVQTPGLGWQWCFLLSVPAATLSILVIASTLRIVRQPVARMRADFAGAALIALGVTSLLICVSTLPTLGATPVLAAVTGGIGVLCLAAAWVVELRADDPILPLRLLAARTPLLCITAAFFAGTTLFGGSVFITQYLQLGVGLLPATAGLLLTPMALGTVVSAFVAGRFISRTGRIRPVLLAGALALFVGNAVLFLMDFSPTVMAVAGTVLIACGLGAVIQNLTLTAQTTVPFRTVGSMSASVAFFLTLGGTIGLVVLGSVLTARVDALRAGGATLSEAYFVGMPLVFGLSALLVIPAIAAIVALPPVHLAARRAP
jgi:MFS family permease